MILGSGLAAMLGCAALCGTEPPREPPSSARIYTVAGSRDVRLPVRAAEPEGALAAETELVYGLRAAAAPDGGVLIHEREDARVRRVDAAGRLATVAGTFARRSRRRNHEDGGGFPDHVPAAGRWVGSISDVDALASGAFLVSVDGPCAVRRVLTDGTVVTVAGGIRCVHFGDGGPATRAGLIAPTAVAASADGGFYVAEPRRVRRVAPDGTIATVAGTGAAGLAGDGGPATRARFRSIGGLDVAPDGSLLVADSGNHRVRRIAPDGHVSTVAGSTRGFAGDGGLAAAARLDGPAAVAALPAGGFVIADTGNHRVREVTPSGRIWTLAGSELPGGGGDGGPAARAQLRKPSDVDVTPNGDVLVADDLNRVVRLIDRRSGTRLAVALLEARVRARAGRATVAFALTRPASVTVEVLGTRQRHTASGRTGVNLLPLDDLRAGEYPLRIVATAGRATAASSGRLSVGSPTTLLDERRGRFAGVRLGGSARRLVEGRAEVWEGDPWFDPRSAFSPPYRSVVATPRSGAEYVSLHTAHGTFILYEGRIRAVLAEKASTAEHVATGDPLDVARSVYGSALRCAVRAVGRYDIEPACAGRIVAGRYLWLAGDPIRTIALSTRDFAWPPQKRVPAPQRRHFSG